MTSASLMHEVGHSELVLWDNPEGWGEREMGGGSGWGDTCAPGGLMLRYEYCKEIILQLK